MSSSLLHSVYLDETLCQGCTTCIKRCPTQAIRVRNGKANIIEERCIDCGECIRACPKGAKKAVSDPLALMDGYDVRIALPAPSLYGQFGFPVSSKAMTAALQTIGFDLVVDVAIGAELLGREIKAEIRKRIAERASIENGSGLDSALFPLHEETAGMPLISSACPVVVRLIQQRFPSLIPAIAPFLPPVEIAAREAKKLVASLDPSLRVGMFFISPCTAKVTAIRMPLGYERSLVDAVFSFQDIFPALKKALLRPSEVQSRFAPLQKRIACMRCGHGMDWARSDGEIDGLGIEQAVSVDGIQNVIALLEEIDNGKFSDVPYIEALACPGGCVGGPMAVANPHVARAAMKHIAAAEKTAASDGGAERAVVADISGAAEQSNQSEPLVQVKFGWECELQPKPVFVLDRDMLKALQMAEQMELIISQLPGLDCGACGSPDCRAFAEDIVKGKAVIEDCLVMMRKKIVFNLTNE